MPAPRIAGASFAGVALPCRESAASAEDGLASAVVMAGLRSEARQGRLIRCSLAGVALEPLLWVGRAHQSVEVLQVAAGGSGRRSRRGRRGRRGRLGLSGESEAAGGP